MHLLNFYAHLISLSVFDDVLQCVCPMLVCTVPLTFSAYKKLTQSVLMILFEQRFISSLLE